MKIVVLLIFCVLAACGRAEKSEPIPQISTDTDGNLSDMAQISEPDLGDSEDMAPDLDEPDLPDDRDIIERLQDAPNVTGVQELSQDAGYRYIVVDFEQKLDHTDPASPTFTHQAFLWHTDDDAPMVLNTTGYGLGDPNQYRGFIAGITNAVSANQIILGHRFFAGGIPSAADQDWSKVTIEQAAADNHEIVASLKTIYDNAWIGTGWSKGGMTAIFHERFHPEDLDVVIPMVSPISLAPLDARYPVWLADIGTAACRQTLDDTMIAGLDRIEELVDVFNPPANQRDAYRQQLKQSIIGFSWAYWQYYGIDYCGFIPAPDALAFDLANFFFLQQTPSPRPISPDEEGIIAYSYQAATQLGFQDVFPTGHLDRMETLGYLTAQERAQYELPFTARPYDWPWGAVFPPFDPAPMADIDTWLRTEATDVIAVYGEYDPWTGGKVTVDEANGSKVFIAATRSHGTMLADLTAEEYGEILAKVTAASNSNLFVIPRIQKPTPKERARLVFMLQNRLL